MVSPGEMYSQVAEPQIARRCEACGAALRNQSRFCPQCGEHQNEASSTEPAARVVLERRQNLREKSILVLDEAATDPGLRFVLVAVAIFAIFLLFLLLSKILR